jgi:hypothetical protein
MVWYGKVWNDKLDDWGHELDDVEPAPPRPKSKAQLREEMEAREWLKRPCYQEPRGNHRLVVVYSGRWRCTKCGFDHERHGIPGNQPDGKWPNYYVNIVHSVGSGMPADGMPGDAESRKW